MPPRPGRKRKRQLDDPLASDSQDEDFSDQAHSPRKRTAGKGTVGKKTATKGGRKTTAAKGRRHKKNTYHSDDDDISISGDSLGVASDDEPVTLGASGRPLRSSRKTQPVNYGEDSEDVEEPSPSESSSGEEEEEADEDVGKKGAKAPTAKPSMLVKIKIPPGLGKERKDRSAEPETQNEDQVPTRRTTRATSATAQSRPTVGGKGPLKSATRTRGGSAGPPAVGGGVARRSTRLGASEEPALQLTTSGKHGEIVRQPGADDVILEERESLAETSSREAIESGCTGGIDEPASYLAGSAVDGNENVQGTDGEPDEVNPQPRDNESGNDIAPPEDADGDDDDSDVQPSRRTGRKANDAPSLRESVASPKAARATELTPDIKRAKRGRGRRGPGRATRGTSKKAGDSSEEYREEEGGDDTGDDSMSNRSSPSKLPRSGQAEIDSGPEDESSEPSGRGRGRKGKRPMSTSQSSRKRRATSSAELSHSEHAEINQELEDLLPSPKRLRHRAKRTVALEGETAPERTLRRRTQNVDYRILRPENAQMIEEPNSGNDEPRRKTAPGAQKSWFDTTGPFGGSVSFNPFGRGKPMNPTVQDDSDSSDDERPTRPGMYGGVVGPAGTIMTPSTATAGLLPPSAQLHGSDPLGGAPGSLGKMSKGKNANADIDPLGAADSNVDFSKVGGLDVVIQNLKEMVQLPLTYPELFLAKKITPPRGVLFHGPPGTGKTLMARALAASCSTEARKVTFYMRKGADCLSKWVGEAERQLRLLFEEAKNNQPSIIFFDEIDGLAPVRSSKQDQIHASIVSTMLALMDGMDGRGQVVVIGATNRPDAVDPALRRPGRFDREFYFPLPSVDARRSILDIHTRGWSPALPEALKEGLALQTKGYGGADLRSLCTEAALNAVQRTYPQIYMTNDKLALDPTSIHVTARDFMLAMKKVVPSSQRSSSSGTDPLPPFIEPLLIGPLEQLKKCMEGILPERKRLTVLEEAMYEDDQDSDGGFSRENMMQDFDQARVFRPRMLIHGASGMGQQYLAAALLNYFEKLHVQAFDLATLVGDSARSVETAIVQLFVEVKRHKPSVVFIPDVDTWYSSIGQQGLITFKSLLGSIPANDPVLLLGVTSSELEDLDPTLLHDLFGFSKRDRFRIPMPNEEARRKYFDRLISYVQKAPNEFPPDPSTRRKRELPVLPVVPPPPPRAMTKEERKAQDAKDKQIKNWLKMRLFYAIDTVRSKLRRFKKPILEYEVIKHLFEEPEATSDLATQGPASNYQLLLPKDIHSPPKVIDTATGKSFYNMDMDVIEERVSNGYYCSAKQFLRDVEYIRDDWMELGHKEHRMKANELLTHLEVIATDIEGMDQAMAAQCAELWSRERKKMEERAEKAERQKRAEGEARLEAEKTRASLDRQSPSVECQIQGGSDKSQERQVTPTEATGNGRDVSINISASAIISTTYPPSNGIGGYSHLSSSMEVQASQISQNDDLTNNGTGTSSRQGSPVALHSPPAQHTQSSEHASAFQTAISSIPANFSQSLVAAADGIPQMTSQPGAALGVTPVTGFSAIMNYASTTTSGKRTSDGTAGLNSQPFSNPYSNSNGTPRPMNPPLFRDFGGISTGDSQLPDTQVVPSSSSDSAPSQTSTTTPAPHSQPSSQPHLHNFSHPAPPFFALPPLQTTKICDLTLLANLHDRLVTETGRYTVEQLEQVNSACMSKVWEMRACWNRNEIIREVSEVFEEVDGDVREGGAIGDGSFGSA